MIHIDIDIDVDIDIDIGIDLNMDVDSDMVVSFNSGVLKGTEGSFQGGSGFLWVDTRQVSS